MRVPRTRRNVCVTPEHERLTCCEMKRRDQQADNERDPLSAPAAHDVAPLPILRDEKKKGDKRLVSTSISLAACIIYDSSSFHKLTDDPFL